MGVDLMSVGSLSKLQIVDHTSRYYWNLRNRREFSTIIKLTLSGRGRMQSRDKVYDTAPGSALLMFATEDTQYFYPNDATQAWKFCWINIMGGDDLFRSLHEQHGPLLEMGIESRSAEQIYAVCDLFDSRGFEDRYHESAVLYRLSMVMMQELNTARKQRSSMDTARDYLMDHHRSYVNVKEVAHHFGMSREHFIRSFRERHGVTPGRFLRHERIGTARYLLENTDFTLDKVAEEIGLGSASAFGRMFRESTGETPL